MELSHNHKSRLLAYFDGQGFERWSAIYGDAEVSRIRRTIRQGHARMLALAEQWLCEALRADDRPTTNDQLSSSVLGPSSVLDAGCGTGLLSLALARRGLRVTAVDIAPQMVAAAAAALHDAGLAAHAETRVADVEAVDGTFDAVACLDVLVHYPAADFAKIAAALAERTRGALVFTYAPHSPLLAGLHWLGGRFPSAHRRTEIQMIPPREVAQVLGASGLTIRRTARISHGFYHVTLVEAARR
jgi:magnesium-protoporphyrin O-methyltransferase